MHVQWTTLDEANPAVFFREKDGNSSAVAQAQPAYATSSLTRSSFCGDAAIGWRPSRPMELASNASGLGWSFTGKQHDANIGPFLPGQRVSYRLGGAGGPTSDEWVFKMPSPRADPVAFLVVADWGTDDSTVDGSNVDASGLVASPVELSSALPSAAQATTTASELRCAYCRFFLFTVRGFDNKPSRNTSARILGEVEAGNASLLLVNGDLSYARGFASIWMSFLDQLQPVAARIPTMTIPGKEHAV